MTYSDWREELFESKARIVVKGLKALKNVIRKGRKTKKPSIFIKNADGTRIQNPNVNHLHLTIKILDKWLEVKVNCVCLIQKIQILK